MLYLNKSAGKVDREVQDMKVLPKLVAAVLYLNKSAGKVDREVQLPKALPKLVIDEPLFSLIPPSAKVLRFEQPRKAEDIFVNPSKY